MSHNKTKQGELLPCPFCGGPVALELADVSYTNQHGKREWWGVKCRNTINMGGSCAIEQIPSASMQAAIERWNRRAPVQANHELSVAYVLDLVEQAKKIPPLGTHEPVSLTLIQIAFIAGKLADLRTEVASRCRAQGGNTKQE